MFQSPHVRLLVLDFPACFRFYRDVLELTPRFNLENVYAEFDVAGQTIALYQRSLMENVVGTHSGQLSAGTQDAAALVLATGNVDQAAEALRAKGIVFVTEPQDRREWEMRTAHFRDPDGHLIEINSPLAQ